MTTEQKEHIAGMPHDKSCRTCFGEGGEALHHMRRLWKGERPCLGKKTHLRYVSCGVFP